MVKGILFDIDGTLLLSNDAHARAWVDAFAEAGFVVPFEQVRKLIGMGGDKLIDALYPEMNDEHGIADQIKDRRTQLFLEKYIHDTKPAPGARELVQAAQQAELQTAVASSAGSSELTALLRAAHVDDLLTQVTTADDADNSKPDPDIVQSALEKIDLPAHDVVMVGDTPYDIQAAAQAGVACIAVRCGGWKDEDLPGALAIFDDPADVLRHRKTVMS